MRFEKHIEIQTTLSGCIDILANECNLSKQAIKQAMNKGAVWLTRNNKTSRLRRVSKTLKAGDQLHIYYDEAVLKSQVEDPVLVADEGSYSVWYKSYGMLSQGSKWGDHCTLNRWAEKNIQPQRPAFIVHRLDRAATGLMLLAHEKSSAAYFSGLFQQRHVDKHYQAIVHGCIKEQMKLNTNVQNKPALSYVEPIAYNQNNDMSLVKVKIETGRKHQIRLHLSAAGFPIVADRLYGDSNKDTAGLTNLCLVSSYIAFKPPDSKQTISYSLPDIYQLKLPI